MAKVDIRDLYCKSGRPIRGLENVQHAYCQSLQSLDFRSLDELKAMAKSGELTPKDVFKSSGQEIRAHNARATWLVINRLRSEAGCV